MENQQENEYRPLILVAEDDDSNFKLIKAIIGKKCDILWAKNGEEIIKELKDKRYVPIIVMSAIHEIDKKLMLFKLGADDYITKPFDMEEVLARVESSLRRTKMQECSKNRLVYKDLILDTDKNTIYLKDEELLLTAKEFAILELLMKYPDKVFSKANLFRSIWNTDYFSEDNTLNVHISNLRSKIKTICPSEDFIDTVWGIGYRLHKDDI